MTGEATGQSSALHLYREGEGASPAPYRDVTLLDLVDRLLDRGVVLSGEVVISVAGIDLVYLSVRALLASAETAVAQGVAGRGTVQ